MSRSGYLDDCGYDEHNIGNLYRATVHRAINGKRGQSFLHELLAALDAMPVKELISDELVTAEGQVCAIGAVCQARGLDVSKLDYEDARAVGAQVGIAWQMAAEIEYENDKDDRYYRAGTESPDQRWQRMRKWAEASIR